MATLIPNNSNKIMDCIKMGSNLDYCYLCANEIKTQSRESFFKEFKELKGKIQGQMILKIRKHGEDICICKKHIKLLNDIINAEPAVEEKQQEEVLEETNPQEEKKKNRTNNKKDDKKE